MKAVMYNIHIVYCCIRIEDSAMLSERELNMLHGFLRPYL